MSVGFSLTGTQALARSFGGLVKQVRQDTGSAVRDSGRLYERELRSRLFMPTQVSRQDASSGRRLNQNPVSATFDASALAVYVKLKPYWIKLRKGDEPIQAVQAVLKRSSYASKLLRRSLWIRRTVFVGQTRVQLEAERLRIADHEWLEEWAERRDRGQQAWAHAAYLVSARAREELLLIPSLKETLPTMIQRIERAAFRGLA